VLNPANLNVFITEISVDSAKLNVYDTCQGSL